MIARLRARHARVWRTLLLVVPIVFVAALSVRRGEPPSHSLPLFLAAEVGALDMPTPADLAPGEWRLARDPGSPQPLLLARRHRYGRVFQGEMLLYWSREPTPSIEALLPLGWPSSDEDWRHLSELLDAAELPPDAVLLGAWKDQELNVFAVPESYADELGALIWFDVHRASVSDVAAAPVAGSLGR